MSAVPSLFPIIVIALFVASAGVILTRIFVSRRQRDSLRRRLEDLLGEPSTAATLPVKRSFNEETKSPLALLPEKIRHSGLSHHLSKIYRQSSLRMESHDFLNTVLVAAVIPSCLPATFDVPVLPCLTLSVLIPALSYFALRQRAESRRNKFLLQLPNAIDLMVSILRSGHSVPQSVRSVSEEFPEPCGEEFQQIFHRMNLGQSLPEALRNTVEHYESFELDLIGKATAIQQEVGGSLAELLEKTNETLRQRIKLKRQVATMTAQARLSALICGLLPFIVAIAFSQISPGYLQPLLEDGKGRLMLIASIILSLTGFMVMRKLSTFRI